MDGARITAVFRRLAVVTLASLGLTSAAACASVEANSVTKEPPLIDLILGELDVRERAEKEIFASTLALFQKSPLSVQTEFPKIGGGTDRYETVRLLIAPSFETYLLVSASYFEGFDGNEDAWIEFLEFNPDPGSDFVRIFNDGEQPVVERIVRSQRSELASADFSRLRRSLEIAEFHAKKFSGENLTWNGTDEKIICLDGTVYYIEANFDNKASVLSRDMCDKEYAADIQLVSGLIDLAMERFPGRADRLASLRQQIAAYEANTELPQ